MGRGRDADGGRPVDPGAARAYGNDPDAVEVHRAGDSAGERAGYGDGRSEVEGLGPDIPASGVWRLQGHEGGEDLAPARRDSVRWGPVWAGLITALTTFLLLQLLAI